jgi:hypothetical protein
MKCSNLFCSRSIGLVAHRRWFSSRHYCSRNCRDAFMADLPQRPHQLQSASTHFGRRSRCREAIQDQQKLKSDCGTHL